MASILPQPVSQFFDRNGKPLSGCSVYFYIPGTSTPKNTYQDEGMTVLNTNPVVLDARGEASVWGEGAFRVVLKDAFGATIYDLETESNLSYTDGQDIVAQINAVVARIASSTVVTDGAGMVGYGVGLAYSAKTVGAKLNRWIDVEDYADAAALAGNWASAFEAAVAAAIATGTGVINASGEYNFSRTVNIALPDNTPLVMNINKVGVTSAFAAPTGYRTALAMFNIGAVGGQNMTRFSLNIKQGDGGGVCDLIQPVGNGFATNHWYLGNMQNFYVIIRMGTHSNPNASMTITGDTWVNNWLGVFLTNGSGAGIVEGWKINVRFIAANNLGSVWMHNAGQYAQIGGDHDFNGVYLGVMHLTDATGLGGIAGTLDGTLTDGTNTMHFMFAYAYEGGTYVVVAADHNISVYNGTGVFPFTPGSTLTSPEYGGVALKFDTVELCGNNASHTNFFDILHDFELSAFAKIQIVAGYLSQVIGGGQTTSFMTYQNSFEGITDNLRGISFTEGADVLSMYRLKESKLPFAAITSDFVRFNRKLSTLNRLIEGLPSNVVLPLNGAFQNVVGLSIDGTDRYGLETATYIITLKTQFSASAYWILNIVGGGPYGWSVLASTVPPDDQLMTQIISDNNGVYIQARQTSQQDGLQCITNAIRI